MNYKNSTSKFLLKSLIFTQLFSIPAQATFGNLGFDSTSFFYKSSDRGTSSTTLKGKIEGSADQKYFHEQGDLSLYTFINDKPTLAVEAKQAYVSLQKKEFDGLDITLGRRIYEWSKIDQTWTMMSLWSPHFTWDPLYPEIIGLTGAFVTYDSSSFHLLAYASPIAIPERGTPIEEKNGTITSSNPFWKPLPKTQNVMGTQTNINYALKMPPMQEILMRPNGAIKAKIEFDDGFWTSLSTGIMPVHQTQLAAEPFLDSSNNGDVQVNIRPQFPMRNLTTLEGGVVAPHNDWDFWVSGSYEQPFQFQNDERWLNPIITPATILSSGTDIELTRNFVFHGGILYIHEQPFSHASSLPAVSVDLPSRFPLKQGVVIGADWRFTDHTRSHGQWVQDLQQRNHFFSLDVQHRFPHSAIEIGAGSDMIIAQTAKGWVGQYNGDDRFRGWLKYAF